MISSLMQIKYFIDELQIFPVHIYISGRLCYNKLYIYQKGGEAR